MLASSSTSHEAASKWRESDKKYFPLVYNTEPKKFPRYKYPKELKDEKVYSLYARTRPQRAPGHDQELFVRADNHYCGACPNCIRRRRCNCNHNNCILRYSSACTSRNGNFDTDGFRWLPNKVSDRLTILAIQDAKAYDERILELASHESTKHLVTEKQIADIRIWPSLHQYGHNYTFTKSDTVPGMQYKGTGNTDGFGVFCCEDCYKEGREQERSLIMAGENHVLQNHGWYERLCDYNHKMKECIAIRKEKEACETQYVLEKHLYWEEQGEKERPKRAATPPPPLPSLVVTLKYRLPKGKEWEAGFGCSECPNVYCDRIRGEGATEKKSLEYHVKEKHPGQNADDLAYRRADWKLRKARPTKRRRVDKEGDDLAPPPPKRRKSQVPVNAAAAPPAFREEVLAVIRFDDAENAFLNSGTSFVTAGRLDLIHHAGVPAIRGAAFRNIHRRSAAENSNTRYTLPHKVAEVFL